MNAIVDGFQNIVQSFSDAIFLAVIKDDRYQYLLDGLKMSLLLTVIAAGIGVVIGMLLAIAKLQDLDNLSGSRFMNGLRRWLAGFANGYISVVRGTPAVVQLMVIYFIIFAIEKIDRYALVDFFYPLEGALSRLYINCQPCADRQNRHN